MVKGNFFHFWNIWEVNFNVEIDKWLDLGKRKKERLHAIQLTLARQFKDIIDFKDKIA